MSKITDSQLIAIYVEIIEQLTDELINDSINIENINEKFDQIALNKLNEYVKHNNINESTNDLLKKLNMLKFEQMLKDFK